MTDAELLFVWKNDKATIENSITKRGVTMEEHLRWLENVIENPMRQLYILDIDGVSVGQLRLDIEKLTLSKAEGKLGNETEKSLENEAVSELRNKERSDFENMSQITAEISYGLGAEHRGKGLGKVLLEQAELLAQIFAIDVLVAEVLPHNMASRKLFTSLGFEEEKKDDLYVYRKRYK